MVRNRVGPAIADDAPGRMSRLGTGDSRGGICVCFAARDDNPPPPKIASDNLRSPYYKPFLSTLLLTYTMTLPLLKSLF